MLRHDAGGGWETTLSVGVALLLILCTLCVWGCMWYGGPEHIKCKSPAAQLEYIFIHVCMVGPFGLVASMITLQPV